MSARRNSLVLAVTLGLLVTMVTAYAAFATHVRPEGATPDRDPFVVAYTQCDTPTTTHDGFYAVGSCDPPVKTSPNLQVGTAESNGAAAAFSGFVKNKVSLIAGPPNPDTADVIISTEIHDIRCTPALEVSAPTKCDTTTPNDFAGPDYIGNVALVAGITLSDHRNDLNSTPGSPVYNNPGTTVPLPVPPLPFSCVATADTTKGSDCAITVSADFVASFLGVELAKKGKRAVLRGSSPVIVDGGDDGDVATSPNENFLTEGLFVP